jgi:small basic protein (TIGR04137 family)
MAESPNIEVHGRHSPALEPVSMTIDKSLKVKAGAIKNRNVLTRAERIAKLLETERWKEGDKVLGLPKVRVMKLALKKKKKAKAEEGAEGAPAAGTAAPAAGAKAAAGAKPAAGAAKPAGKK